jgi:hypothetical protein
MRPTECESMKDATNPVGVGYGCRCKFIKVSLQLDHGVHKCLDRYTSNDERGGKMEMINRIFVARFGD